MRRLVLLALALLAGCTGQASPGREPGAHPRLVSLNPCSDAVLAEVADPGQLLAVSTFSQQPASTSMELATARHFRGVSGSAEEIAALRPDLVVSDQFLPPATESALRSLRIPVARLPIAGSVGESEAQVMRLAVLAGHPERGATIVTRIEAALARAAPPAGAPAISAVVWQSGGIVPGSDTLIGDLLRRTGFRLASAARGLHQADVLPLELLVADPPRVILAAGNPLGNEDRQLRHPALAALTGTRRERLEPSLLWCGGPTVERAAARLAAIRATL